MAAAAGKAAADRLARGRIAGRVQPGHRGGAVGAGQAQAAGAAHRAFQPQGHGETLGKGIDAAAIERQEEIGLRGAHGGTGRLVGQVQPGVDLLAQEFTSDDRTPALGRRARNRHAIGIGERRPVIEQRLGDRTEFRRNRVGVGKFHAGQFRAQLGGHQQPVAGQHIAAQRAAQERTAAGSDDHRAGAHRPGAATLAVHPGGARHGAIGVTQQFQYRMVVQDLAARLLDLLAHQAHVFRALQRIAARHAGRVLRKRIAPVGQGIDAVPGLVQHAAHPAGIGQAAAHLVAAGHGGLALLRVRVHVPDGGAGSGRGARRTTVALVRQDHAGARLCGLDRGPRPRGSAADDEDVRLVARIGAALRRRVADSHGTSDAYLRDAKNGMVGRCAASANDGSAICKSPRTPLRGVSCQRDQATAAACTGSGAPWPEPGRAASSSRV
ncbi:hypothetical protein LMG3458_05040 [Achromobacter deleyi]|uniref:Uncharacterized protein n=1 Tax=Achromobacter deleyi TaxID=1353891 RepID=A0A6S7AHV1_9BURK|nr:hypothetical protein LMG3458_05040 [Achromobacter deleyi]CAB3892258.1 hypothetical protein LMG3481_03832 [Achromobacter deleyi]CAB3917088.1 hypothetical protein LMG3482_05160 [Achromobacter deleyi]